MIYAVNPDCQPVEPSNRLGGLMDKMDPSESIIEFASTGPKSYTFHTSTGRTVIRLKGVTLTSDSSKPILLDSMRRLVFGIRPNQIRITEPWRIQRNILTANITTAPYTKMFQMTYDKRRLLRDAETGHFIHMLPFGYKGEME